MSTQKDKQDDKDDQNSETSDCMNTALYHPKKEHAQTSVSQTRQTVSVSCKPWRRAP